MRKLSWSERWRALVRGQLAALPEHENSIAIGRSWLESERDRRSADRADVLQDALEAWRLNPLARRMVELVTQYVVGGGINFTCRHVPTQAFLRAFWEHRHNRMGVRIYELCDELTRSGNLFLLLSTDASGMSYLRCVPAADIERIESRPNDIEQPLRFWPHAAGGLEPVQPYPAYDPDIPALQTDGSFAPVMLHYTINRPAGAQWGESDLAPVLRWISRYAAWLEDRARLNRFRTAFLYVVKSRFASESERAARQATLAANPPAPGSILVTDESETWEVISPKLESAEAAEDGLALKKMLAAGAGLPMHFLAEPESSTRTTAEAAGGPTYRRFEQRQRTFLWILSDLFQVVAARRRLVDGSISRKPMIEVRGADISARDNVALAMAASNLQGMLESLRARGLIDNAEFLRMAYRFCGETIDVPAMLDRAEEEGLPPQPPAPSARPRPAGSLRQVDPLSGEDKL